MEIKILKKDENHLLSRAECRAEMKGLTPSYPDLKKAIAENMKKDESLIAIKRIDQKFGKRVSEADFYVYSNSDSFSKFEDKKKKKKAEAKEEAK